MSYIVCAVSNVTSVALEPISTKQAYLKHTEDKKQETLVLEVTRVKDQDRQQELSRTRKIRYEDETSKEESTFQTDEQLTSFEKTKSVAVTDVTITSSHGRKDVLAQELKEELSELQSKTIKKTSRIPLTDKKQETVKIKPAEKPEQAAAAKTKVTAPQKPHEALLAKSGVQTATPKADLTAKTSSLVPQKKTPESKERPVTEQDKAKRLEKDEESVRSVKLAEKEADVKKSQSPKSEPVPVQKKPSATIPKTVSPKESIESVMLKKVPKKISSQEKKSEEDNGEKAKLALTKELSPRAAQYEDVAPTAQTVEEEPLQSVPSCEEEKFDASLEDGAIETPGGVGDKRGERGTKASLMIFLNLLVVFHQTS